jgi:hypothetical protein
MTVAVHSVQRLEMLTAEPMQHRYGLKANKKISAFYGSQRFITLFTRSCNLSLSTAQLIHSIVFILNHNMPGKVNEFWRNRSGEIIYVLELPYTLTYLDVPLF